MSHNMMTLGTWKWPMPRTPPSPGASSHQLYYLLLRRHIPDWHEREQELDCWTLVLGDRKVSS